MRQATTRKLAGILTALTVLTATAGTAFGAEARATVQFAVHVGPRDGAPLRYAFQGRQGRVDGPTAIGVVAASGAYRLPLTLTLDPRTPAPVRVPLAFRAGAATRATSTVTRVEP